MRFPRPSSGGWPDRCAEAGRAPGGAGGRGDRVAARRAVGGAAAGELDDGLVLELVEPGDELGLLAHEDDDAATLVVADVLRRFWVPAPPARPLPTVAQACAALSDDAACAPLPRALVTAAREALRTLLADAPPAVVLHGDLHHGNVLLSRDRGWVAIDPHGVVGDPGYDVGPVSINPLGVEPGLVHRRLDLLATALDLDRDRLAGWGLVRAVLSEAWHVQDTGRPHGGPLAVAGELTG